MEDRNYIKNKRIERKKKRRKQFFVRLMTFLMVAAVITLTVLSLTIFFPITSIVIRNPEPYTAEQIVEISGIKKGQNLFMAAKNSEEAITTKLPYISEVKISRKLPSTIIITAKKATAEKGFRTKDGYLICDKERKLLEIKIENIDNLIVVEGCEFKNAKIGYVLEFKNEEQAKSADAVLDKITSESYKVSQIDITDIANIKFKIENRFIVKLGSASNIENKILHLEEMLKNIDENAQGSIDLSYWTEENPRGIFKNETIN